MAVWGRMMKASRPKPKRAPAAKKAAAQRKHKIFDRMNSPQGGSQASSKRKPNAQASQNRRHSISRARATEPDAEYHDAATRYAGDALRSGPDPAGARAEPPKRLRRRREPGNAAEMRHIGDKVLAHGAMKIARHRWK